MIKLAISFGLTAIILIALLMVAILALRHAATIGEFVICVLLLIVFVSVWSATYDLLFRDDKTHG